MKHIASVSFGKDSLAMLLMLIEKGYPLDEVMFYDTGMEFQAIYDLRDKIKPILRERGIEYTELHPVVPFPEMMFEHPIKWRDKPGYHCGYGWCGGAIRWGTGEKLKVLENRQKGGMGYIGIAADEFKRIDKERRDNVRMPLVDWEMTEKDCLEYCYSKGFYWEENGIRLYDILDRVSCWCCTNKNLKELKNIYQFLPEYWQRLREMQFRLDRPMKGPGKSVFELEERFRKEIVGG